MAFPLLIQSFFPRRLFYHTGFPWFAGTSRSKRSRWFPGTKRLWRSPWRKGNSGFPRQKRKTRSRWSTGFPRRQRKSWRPRTQEHHAQRIPRIPRLGQKAAYTGQLLIQVNHINEYSWTPLLWVLRDQWISLSIVRYLLYRNKNLLAMISGFPFC